MPDLGNAPRTVMFIRHGEKPSDHGVPHGINHHGEPDDHSLSVRGWTRAGALAGLFAYAPTSTHPGVVTPARIVATKPSHKAKSHREVDTAGPVARRLDVDIEGGHGHGDIEPVRDDILSSSADTLVVWHHGELADLVRAFPVRNLDDVPDHWPGDRFDLVWLLTRATDDPAYTFTEVNQHLLDGDAET